MPRSTVKKILIINPGSTSTKIEFWSDARGTLELQKEAKIEHPIKDLTPFLGKNVTSQIEFRKEKITDFLASENISLDELDFIMGRGGFVPQPRLQSGIYSVNQKMVDDLTHHALGNHASNLGAILAHNLAAGKKKIQTAIMDPVVVDEMVEISRISGMKLLPNKSFIHVLNQKAVARKCADEMGKKYQECNFIVTHMGGGISLAAHRKGRIVDAYNGLNGMGPFSPGRSGSVEPGQLIDLCFLGKYTRGAIHSMNVGRGGMMDHLGTNDLKEVEQRIADGDKYAEIVFQAMALQVSKFLISLAAVFEGEPIDAAIITGGMAYSKDFTNAIIQRVNRIAPIKLYPGGLEGQALAEGAYRVLTGSEQVKEYTGLETGQAKN